MTVERPARSCAAHPRSRTRNSRDANDARALRIGLRGEDAMVATMGTQERRGSVTLSVFGDRRYTTTWPGTDLTVAAVLAEHGVDVGGRRVAKNGLAVAGDATVLPGDEVTVVPRVVRG
jgi:hypothetical protein